MLEAIENAIPIGPPDIVAERLIRDIDAVGITDLSCFAWPAGMPLRSVLRSMERFATEVLPRVRAHAAARPPAARAVA